MPKYSFQSSLCVYIMNITAHVYDGREEKKLITTTTATF